jgi:Na+-transporting methylmalonyl-CoA/oxaloacetate decarboxylase gamma subunit
MKRMIIAIVLISLFLLAGCAKQEISPVVEETGEPEAAPVEEQEGPAEMEAPVEQEVVEEETEEPAEEFRREVDVSAAAGELVFDVECDGNARTVWFRLANTEDRDLYFATVSPMERNKYYPAKAAINGRDVPDIEKACGTLKVPMGEVVDCVVVFPEPRYINEKILRIDEDKDNHIRVFIAGKASEVLFSCETS